MADLVNLRIGDFGAERDHAFAAANRHSALVKGLKITMPVLAALGALGFGAYVWLDPFHRPQASVDVSSLQLHGDRLTMELPHLTGFNRNQQSYNVTAKTASQRLTAPGQIELSGLDAVISMADKSTANLKALTGNFDSSAEILTLDKQVNVVSTKGYKADLTSARVDFKSGTVVSNEPVSVDVGAGKIRAGTMIITSGGQVIAFHGGVNSTFQARVSKMDAGTSPTSPADKG